MKTLAVALVASTMLLGEDKPAQKPTHLSGEDKAILYKALADAAMARANLKDAQIAAQSIPKLEEAQRATESNLRSVQDQVEKKYGCKLQQPEGALVDCAQPQPQSSKGAESDKSIVK